MEALSGLMNSWPDVDRLADLFESAFILVGHPEAWTCNNRMETIQAFALNIDKISSEVGKYPPLPKALNRMELSRRTTQWKYIHQTAVKFMNEKSAPLTTPLPGAVLSFLRSDVDLGEVPAYFRCLFSKEDPVVMIRHGQTAREELGDINMEGFEQFLKFKGWLLDLTQFAGRENKSPDDEQGLSGDESSAEESSIHNSETNSASITYAQRRVSDLGLMPPIPAVGYWDSAGVPPQTPVQHSSFGAGKMPHSPESKYRSAQHRVICAELAKPCRAANANPQTDVSEAR